MKHNIIISIALFLSSCTPGFDAATYQQQFETKTGLHIDSADASSGYLSKIHRGYPILVHTKMGNVWGRYGARLAASQIGPELGRVGAFLTGTYESGVGGITGSPFDRALSKVIGQPISLFIVLKHNLASAPQLDIVSKSSTINSERSLKKVNSLGSYLWGEEVFGDDRLWQKISQSKNLVDQLSRFRSHYILVDDRSVTFMFAGTETDYSGMINEFSSYEEFIIAIMNSLADIADFASERQN